jgi:hypothetical protein
MIFQRMNPFLEALLTRRFGIVRVNFALPS